MLGPLLSRTAGAEAPRREGRGDTASSPLGRPGREGRRGEGDTASSASSALGRPCLHLLSEVTSNGPGAQQQLSLSLFLHFVWFFKCTGTGPLPQHSITVPRGGHCRTQTAGRMRSHCSPRGCAGLLQAQGSAQPAGEVHFLPLGALDESVVLKDAGYQSQPQTQACSVL